MLKSLLASSVMGNWLCEGCSSEASLVENAEERISSNPRDAVDKPTEGTVEAKAVSALREGTVEAKAVGALEEGTVAATDKLSSYSESCPQTIPCMRGKCKPDRQCAVVSHSVLRLEIHCSIHCNDVHLNRQKN